MTVNGLTSLFSVMNRYNILDAERPVILLNHDSYSMSHTKWAIQAESCSFHKIYIELYGDCVFDDPNNRFLKGYFFTSPEMTVEMCLATCREKGFRYSGLQWNIECYCGDEPNHGFEWAWLDKCDTKCAGDSNQICGGTGAMSVYSTRGVREANRMKQKGFC